MLKKLKFLPLILTISCVSASNFNNIKFITEHNATNNNKNLQKDHNNEVLTKKRNRSENEYNISTYNIYNKNFSLDKNVLCALIEYLVNPFTSNEKTELLLQVTKRQNYLANYQKIVRES